MKLSKVKSILANSTIISFQLPDGSLVPAHFHVTEVGQVTKKFIDCGGKVREESAVNFQLWEANDYDHRINPGKLVDIIELSEKVLSLEDLDVEVEYQMGTIGRFDLDHDGNTFLLKNKETACLAAEVCGIPIPKKAIALATAVSSCCTPDGGCC